MRSTGRRWSRALLILFAAACGSAVAPCLLVELEGCLIVKEVPLGPTTLVVRERFTQCSTINRDSLVAAGWKVVPDSGCAR